MNQVDFQSELAHARDRLEQDLDALVQLRPLPAIAMQIMKACGDQQTNVREVVRLVECDNAFASRILSVVNSSVYGYSRAVTSINQAVVVLGFTNLSQLAIAIASEKVFADDDSTAGACVRLYEHSLGCATVSRLLVNSGEVEGDAGAAFLAGMLHDVGKLVLFDIAPAYYTQLQDDEEITAMVETEQAAFGTDHSKIGCKFGDIWGLPPLISNAIAGHHTSDQPIDSISQVTSLANELSKAWGVGQPETETHCDLAQAWMSTAGPDRVEQLRVQACEQYEELKSLMKN